MSITFYYSTMGAGKSTFALQLNYQLKESGFRTLLCKPKIDTRDEGIVSRIGLSSPVDFLFGDGQIEEALSSEITHIIIDEGQFLTRKEIENVCCLADNYDIDVIAFGLRTSYTGELFEGSATWFALADNLVELPTLYKDGNKTIMHILTLNGKEIFDGEMIHVGDQEYESVSRKEFFKRKLLTFPKNSYINKISHP